ncbi:MAG: tannase/feruloyl esterase family alpha/beta hydrolase [Steroidobacteraceae bacterium]
MVLALQVPRAALAAIHSCTARAVARAAPAGMIIGKVTDLALDPLPAVKRGVAYVPANGLHDGAPQFCLITGRVLTDPGSRTTANFAAVLPSRSRWNGKFLLEGCGGFCGQMKFWGPPAAAQLRKGFPVWITDDGHRGRQGPSVRFPPADDPSWGARGDRRVTANAVTDYEYRAVHTLTRLGKQFTKRFYGHDTLRRSYFVGCSDGGREAMVELTRYPRDYDGIVAGSPFFDMTNQLVTSAVGVLAQLRSPAAVVPPRLLRLLGRIITAKCDAADGVQDGLIQNPARCDFDPERDLPLCGNGRATRACFTPAQTQALDITFSATRDPAGRVLFPGFEISDPGYELGKSFAFAGAPSDLRGPDPWRANPAGQPLAWYMGKGILDDVLRRSGREASLRSLGISFRWDTVDGAPDLHAVISDKVVASLEARSAAGSGVSPLAARAFLDRGGKLIMYHGLSDGLITPYRSIQYYRALAHLYGGYGRLQPRAELFLAPGMGHCGGGPGPDYFGQFFHEGGPSGAQPLDARDDVVTALDHWVDGGTRPRDLIATKYEHDVIGDRVIRKMPLCPYPEEARYRGGSTDRSASWVCSPKDARLEESDSAGARAGVDAPLRLLTQNPGRPNSPGRPAHEDRQRERSPNE